MHHAAYNGHLSCLLTLIKSGAQIDAEDKLGRSPLWFAFRRLQKIQEEESKKANLAELEKELYEAFKQIDEDDDKSLSIVELRIYAGHFEEIEWSDLRDALEIGEAGGGGKTSFTWDEFLEPIMRPENFDIRDRIYNSIVLRRIKQRESIQNELIRHLLESGAFLENEDNHGVPAFGLPMQNKWYTDSIDEMYRVYEHPKELGYDSDIFQDARTQSAVQVRRTDLY